MTDEVNNMATKCTHGGGGGGVGEVNGASQTTSKLNDIVRNQENVYG